MFSIHFQPSQAFVIPANFLFKLSITLYIIAIYLHALSHLIDVNTNVIMSILGLSFGLFKFLFIVIILDQAAKKWIQIKIGIWFILENLYYIVVYIFLPPYNMKHWEISIILLIFNIITISALLIGIYTEDIFIDSNVLGLILIIKKFLNKNSEYQDTKEILKTISKSTIIFFLLLPYGISDSQVEYMYAYQSRCLSKPFIGNYLEKPLFWTNCMSAVTSVLILLTFLFLCYKFGIFRKFYTNIQLKIIIGNISFILAAIMSGILELYRSNSSIKFDNQTSDISVFGMLPQMFLLSISEVLVLSSCYEFIYLQSTTVTKYFSVALITSTIGAGGLPNVINLVLYNTKYFEKLHCVRKNGEMSRLGIILYSFSAISIIALVVCIGIMRRFKNYFTFLEYTELNKDLVN